MFGANAPHKKRSSRSRSAKRVASRSRAKTPVRAAPFVATPHRPASHLSRLPKKHYILSPWTEPTFADSTAGDLIDGEDLVVRRAAVQALGPFNGTIVVADPASGRILSIVNQKLAYKDGFEPCSTIKLVAALAGLSEGVINQNTLLQIGVRRGMTLTDAIAHSNNPFFFGVGEKLGFERVSKYAKLYGLGERASTIEEEQPGLMADAPPADGTGMMTVFGLGISQTPLQLAALVSSIANGGTLYYLQHPKSQDEIAQFVPRVKRRLDIEQYIPYMKPGMMGAVEFGTARRAAYNPNEPIFGKTGTCTDNRSPVHLGWFGSFNEVGSKKIVVVVLLTGGKPVNGPVAAGVAGAVYKNLSQENYFGQGSSVAPVALVSTQE
jgi:cell division protein FtsI/penicillin-binding protein 2